MSDPKYAPKAPAPPVVVPRRSIGSLRGRGLVHRIPRREEGAADIGVYKACACGEKYTRFEWARLHLRGRQTFEVDATSTETLEYRDCICGSTLAVVVGATAPPEEAG